jgi:hypothetical protein
MKNSTIKFITGGSLFIAAYLSWIVAFKLMATLPLLSGAMLVLWIVFAIFSGKHIADGITNMNNEN